MTFVVVITNDTSSPVYDGNELTWSPLLETSTGLPTVKVLFNVPNLEPVTAGLTPGWAVSVSEIVRGSDQRNGADVNVTVSMNGQDYSTQPIVFHYQNVPEVQALVPTHGPIRGGTEVLLMGNNFNWSPLLACRFGTESTGVVPVALFINASAIICISPPKLFSGLQAVAVSSNGVFSATQASIELANFTYDADIAISSFYPTLGSTNGLFPVHVLGGPFINTSELRCRFADIRVVATFLDTGEIVCLAPPYAQGVYPLEVSMNDQDYTNLRRPFFFSPEISIQSLFPPSGPALSAGTEVIIRGYYFINSSSLSCRFANVTTGAIYISSTEIMCRSPTLLGTVLVGDDVNGGGLSWTEDTYPVTYFYPRNLVKLVSVEVSNNAQEFTSSGLMFLYQADAIVSGLFPPSGFLEESNPVAVLGNNFVNSTFLRCRFGAEITNATFINRNAIICFTPRYSSLRSHHRYENKFQGSSMQLGPSVVVVEVANNGQDFTNNRLTYEYETKCLSGFYCPQLNFIPCPPGT